jgi:hypothetical protein
MQKAAQVDFTLPVDMHDVEQVQRMLREYVLQNLNAWIGGNKCSVWMAFAALKNTYAINQEYYKSLLQAARAQSTPRTAPDGRKLASNGLPIRTEVKGDYWIAYPPIPEHNPDTWAGGAPVANRGGDAHRSERFQRVAEFKNVDAASHGARAFCPPEDEGHAAPCAYRNAPGVQAELASARSDRKTSLHSGDIAGGHEVRPYGQGSTELAIDQRAECPRSVNPAPSATCGDDQPWRRGDVTLKADSPSTEPHLTPQFIDLGIPPFRPSDSMPLGERLPESTTAWKASLRDAATAPDPLARPPPHLARPSMHFENCYVPCS